MPSGGELRFTPRLHEQARAAAAANGHAEALYLARGGCLGMNGNYSAGILEGIAHYHPEARVWMGLAENTDPA